jgi:ketosteroid isomerase-like protein
MAKDHGFAEALERVETALAAIGSGDPEPYIDCWAKVEDATLFGAWGPIEKGHQQLVETFRWVGRRFKSGSLVPENTVAFASGDLAYTVGFEHKTVVLEGKLTTYTLRVTQVYRREDGVWKVVHRHGDHVAHNTDHQDTAGRQSAEAESATA